MKDEVVSFAMVAHLHCKFDIYISDLIWCFYRSTHAMLFCHMYIAAWCDQMKTDIVTIVFRQLQESYQLFFVLIIDCDFIG